MLGVFTYRLIVIVTFLREALLRGYGLENPAIVEEDLAWAEVLPTKCQGWRQEFSDGG